MCFYVRSSNKTCMRAVLIAGAVERMTRKKSALPWSENPNESLIIGLSKTSTKKYCIAVSPPVSMTYNGACAYYLFRTLTTNQLYKKDATHIWRVTVNIMYTQHLLDMCLIQTTNRLTLLADYSTTWSSFLCIQLFYTACHCFPLQCHEIESFT